MSPLVSRFAPFLAWRNRVNARSLRADAIAGAIGALVVLPQGVAYATLAGMPPEYGLYCAMLPVVVAALWGSSWHQISGPTNAMSLVVFATIAPLAVPGSPDYVRLVLTLCLVVGTIQLAMGLARLGSLVNFISHTVIVGFTAGAALLIIAAQLQNFFGIPIARGASFAGSLQQFATGIRSIDPWITATGVVTLVVALAARRLPSTIPPMVVAMLAGSLFAFALSLAGFGNVPTVGALPSGIPSLSAPSFDPQVWRQLAPAAFALTVLGLTEAVSIARAVALKSGQRIDGSQEFIGQGLSNLVGAFASSYPSSGSFNRSGVNYAAGAVTPLAAVFSAVVLMAVLVAVAPLAAYLPLAVMAGLLFVVAWGLIDIGEMRRIVRSSRGDTLVLALTFAATLTLQLEFAIFVGVLISLLVYLNRTTHPRLTHLAPDAQSPLRRFAAVGEKMPPCPQLDVLRIDGSLFFGAVEHVRDELAAARAERPEVKHRLLECSGINFVDIAGAELIVQEARLARETGEALYLCEIKPGVAEVLERSGALAAIGADRVFDTKHEAIPAIYARLDPATCAACTVRVFTECQDLLPDGKPRDEARPAFVLTPVGPTAAGRDVAQG